MSHAMYCSRRFHNSPKTDVLPVVLLSSLGLVLYLLGYVVRKLVIIINNNNNNNIKIKIKKKINNNNIKPYISMHYTTGAI